MKTAYLLALLLSVPAFAAKNYCKTDLCNELTQKLRLGKRGLDESTAPTPGAPYKVTTSMPAILLSPYVDYGAVSKWENGVLKPQNGLLSALAEEMSDHTGDRLGARGEDTSTTQRDARIKAGESVYVYSIVDTPNLVQIQLTEAEPQTRTERGSTKDFYYGATLQFPFAKGALKTLTSDQVMEVIEQVIQPVNAPAKQSPAQSATSSSNPLKGLTLEQVEKLLGKDHQDVSSSTSRTILSYPKMLVVFENGVVVDTINK